MQRRTWRVIIEGDACDEWRTTVAECSYVKKLAFRSIAASGAAPAQVEGFVGLSADKSARQLEAELGPAHWEPAEGSEWAQIKADLSFEVVLPPEDADELVRRGVPRDLRVQPGWVSRHAPNLEQLEAEPAAITPGGQHAVSEHAHECIFRCLLWLALRAVDQQRPSMTALRFFLRWIRAWHSHLTKYIIVLIISRITAIWPIR